MISTVATVGVALMSQRPSKADAEEDKTAAILQEYLDLGTAPSAKNLEAFRKKHNFVRNADGRITVRGKKDSYSVRLDMEAPGTLLLRDSKGNIYLVQTEAMAQVDLSDDLIVLLLFSNSDWEDSLAPVQYLDEKEKVQQLQLDEQIFRGLTGLAKSGNFREAN